MEPVIPAADALVRIAASRAALASLAPRVIAGGPWPLAERFGAEPEASWGPREVLAHLNEMLPYWLGEFGRIVEADRPAADPLPFGRQSGDIVRVGVIERDRTFPLADLFERIDDGIARWERRIAATTPAEGARLGRHPRDGVMTADGLRDQMIVRHLEGHVVQLEEILARA
jgi:hypothetical protein